MNAIDIARLLTPERLARLQAVAGQRQMDVSVVCENLHDPHNIAAVMRSCDGFGIQTIDVIGQDSEFKGDPKSSGSARHWLDIRPWENVTECFVQLHEEGKTIYVTKLDPSAKSIYEVDFTQPCAIVLGNEHGGVSDEVATLADQSVYIPMAGMVQSFNVSVAGAIVLAELYRQRQAEGLYEPWHNPRQEELLERWLEREIDSY